MRPLRVSIRRGAYAGCVQPSHATLRMSMLSFVWLFAGLSLLLGGAFLALRGASQLAEWLRFSPAMRGLVPIALAATLPEIAVAGWATSPEFDLPDLAIGDVVGGVIANYLLALAVAALALPLAIAPRLLNFAFPLALLAALAMLGAAWTGEITEVIGASLVAAAVVWPVVAIRLDRRDASPRSSSKRERSKRAAAKPSDSADSVKSRRSSIVAALSCSVGAFAIYFGASWFLVYAIETADALGLSKSTSGLTVVALVTTFPEAVACLVMTLRGDREAAVGVVVGSSLFNLSAALGLAAARSPGGLEVSPVLFEFALPIAIAAGLACVPAFYGMRRLSRGSGLALFAFYAAFFVYATVVENGYAANDPIEAQQTRFYAMFLIAIGLIVVLSVIALVERLVQKARVADD